MEVVGAATAVKIVVAVVDIAAAVVVVAANGRHGRRRENSSGRGDDDRVVRATNVKEGIAAFQHEIDHDLFQFQQSKTFSRISKGRQKRRVDLGGIWNFGRSSILLVGIVGGSGRVVVGCGRFRCGGSASHSGGSASTGCTAGDVEKTPTGLHGRCVGRVMGRIVVRMVCWCR